MTNDVRIISVMAGLLAETQLLLKGFRLLCEAAHIQEIEGVPLNQWIDQQRIDGLESFLLTVGDTNIPLYNAIQATIADAKRKASNG